MHARKKQEASHLPHPVSGRVPEIKPKLEKVKVALNVCLLIVQSTNPQTTIDGFSLERRIPFLSLSLVLFFIHTIALFVSNVGVLVLDSCSSLAPYTTTQARYRG